MVVGTSSPACGTPGPTGVCSLQPITCVPFPTLLRTIKVSCKNQMKNHMVRSNPVIGTEAGGRPRKCLFSLQCSGMLLSGDPGGRPSDSFLTKVAQPGLRRPASQRDSRDKGGSLIQGMARRSRGARVASRAGPPAQTSRQLHISWPLPGGRWGP